MKKSFVTFCAFVLLATQASVAGAATVEKEEKQFQYKHIFDYYKQDVQSSLIANFPNLQYLKDMIEELNIKEKARIEAREKAKAEAKAKAKVEAEAKVKAKAKEKEKEKAKVAVEEKANVGANDHSSSNSNAQSSNHTNNAKSSKPTNTTSNNSSETTASTVTQFELQVVELTNQERQKAGVAPLSIDTPLMNAAREKSQNMKDYNYFSHTSPNLGSPFDRLKALGISYRAAAENIAKGQSSPEEVVKSWMNSQGHRENILNEQFTHIGVGYVKEGHIWTQQFIQK